MYIAHATGQMNSHIIPMHACQLYVRVVRMCCGLSIVLQRSAPPSSCIMLSHQAGSKPQRPSHYSMLIYCYSKSNLSRRSTCTLTVSIAVTVHAVALSFASMPSRPPLMPKVPAAPIIRLCTCSLTAFSVFHSPSNKSQIARYHPQSLK